MRIQLPLLLLCKVLATLLLCMSSVKTQQYSMIDFTQNLLEQLPSTYNHTDRVLFTCVPGYFTYCYSFTKEYVINYTFNDQYAIKTKTVTKIQNTLFPSQDIVDVFLSSDGVTILAYWQEDPTSQIIQLFCFTIYTSVYSSKNTIDDVIKFKPLLEGNGLILEVKDPTTQLLTLYKYECSYLSQLYFTMNDDVLYWNVFLDYQYNGYYKQSYYSVLLAYENRIELYSLKGQVSTLLANTTINGRVIDPDTQITSFNTTTRIKYYNSALNCVTFLEYSKVNLVLNISLPYITNLMLPLASAGYAQDAYYQQLNATVLIQYNSTYYSAVVDPGTIVGLSRVVNTVVLLNQGYVDVINLNPYPVKNITVNTTSSFMQSISSYFSNDTKLVNTTTIPIGIQSTQQGQALYVSEVNPITIRNDNGDIQVTSLDVNVNSVQIFALSNLITKVYFSARINGQWKVIQAGQQVVISSSEGIGFYNLLITAMITFLLLRGIISVVQSFYLNQSMKEIVNFIKKETQMKIPFSIFSAHYSVIYEEKLGEGSFGVVYACELIKLDGILKALAQRKRLLACKIIPISPESELEALSEIEALISVRSCKSAIQIMNYCVTKTHIYIVLERAEQSLESYLTQRFQQPFSNDEVIQIAFDLTEVLVQLRNNNFYHRDIKPSNILIMPDKQVKLTDFGAAQQKDLSNYTIKNDQLIGSIPWMSPELLLALEVNDEASDSMCVQNIDYEKCDIFSLGLTLIYVILRQKLKGCNHKEETILKVYKQMDTEYTHINADFRLMLRKMTSFNPTKRPSCFLIKQHLLKIQGYTVSQMTSKTEKPVSSVSTQKLD